MEIIQTPVNQNKLTRLEKERLEREAAEERADLAEKRADLAEERADLAEERADLAEERVRQEMQEKQQTQDHMKIIIKGWMNQGVSREKISELCGLPLDQIPIQ